MEYKRKGLLIFITKMLFSHNRCAKVARNLKEEFIERPIFKNEGDRQLSIRAGGLLSL